MKGKTLFVGSLGVRAFSLGGRAFSLGVRAFSAALIILLTLTAAPNASAQGGNAAPTVANPLAANIDAIKGSTFSHPVPANTFADSDTDILTITATLADDTARPTWLKFTNNMFSGMVPDNAPDRLAIKVTADDGNGGMASSSFNLHLHDTAHPDPATQTTLEGNVVILNAQTFGYRGEADGSFTLPLDSRFQSLTITTLPPAADGRIVLATSLSGTTDEVLVMQETPVTAGMAITPTTLEDMTLQFVPAIKLTNYMASFTYTTSYTPPTGGTPSTQTHTMQITVTSTGTAVRGTNVQHGLSGFARSLGWGMTEAINRRSSLNHRGDNQNMDVGAQVLNQLYNAAEGRSGRRLEGMNLWADVQRSNLEFGAGAAPAYDGDMTNIRLGLERPLKKREGMTLGLAIDIHDGELEFADAIFSITGDLEISGWSLNPYLLWSSDSYRAWGTVGFGLGDLDYSDKTSQDVTTTDSADVRITMLAGGTEYDLTSWRNTEILGRIEIMAVQLKAKDADGNIFRDQTADAQGIRSELEVGWPLQVDASGSSLRPWITLGYRIDGGDGDDGTALEYGTGIAMQTTHYTLDVSVRTQRSADDGDFDRTSYAVLFSYDSNNDGQGMMLKLTRKAGLAKLDPFAGAISANERAISANERAISANERALSANDSNSFNFEEDRLNVEFGYGLVFGSLQRRVKSHQRRVKSHQRVSNLLTFRAATSLNQGVQGRFEYGLTLERLANDASRSDSGNPRYELLFIHEWSDTTATSGRAALLRLTRQF